MKAQQPTMTLPTVARVQRSQNNNEISMNEVTTPHNVDETATKEFTTF